MNPSTHSNSATETKSSVWFWGKTQVKIKFTLARTLYVNVDEHPPQKTPVKTKAHKSAERNVVLLNVFYKHGVN